MEVEPIIRAYAAEGRGEDNKDQLMVMNKNGITDEKLNEFLSSKISYDIPRPLVGACEGCNGSLNVSYTGDVYPCPPMNNPDYFLGNILDVEDFAKFVEDEQYKCENGYKEFASKFPENSERCKECDVNLYCWHCIFQHEHKMNSDIEFENICKVKYHDLSALVWEGG